MKYEYRIIFDADSSEQASNIAEVIAHAILENKTRQLNSELTVTIPELMVALVEYKPEEE